MATKRTSPTFIIPHSGRALAPGCTSAEPKLCRRQWTQRQSTQRQSSLPDHAVRSRPSASAETLWSAVAICLLVLLTTGCTRDTAPPSPEPPTDASAATTPPAEPVDVAPQTYETGAKDLLAMRLPDDRAAEGWIRLFDGHTLFGWEIATEANFRIEDKSIVVDAGKPGLMCTSMPWENYELHLEYKLSPGADSGVYLRSPLQPSDTATECYEINLAGDDHPYPAGSIASRQKRSDEVSLPDTDDFRSLDVTLDGGKLTVRIDGELVTEYEDDSPLPGGRIGLQFYRGRVEFREVQLRPLGLESMITDELDQWTRYEEMEGEFTVSDNGALLVKGGKTQLETKASYGNFTLLATYRLAAPDTNTGIFFRCIPGEEMMGYECQVNDAVKDNNPLTPADAGTGGIFRRQDARIVPGRLDQFNHVVLHVQGPQMAAWVNGLQVSNFYDTREANENPRKGKRTDPGTIMIQGHDPETKAMYKQLAIMPAN